MTMKPLRGLLLSVSPLWQGDLPSAERLKILNSFFEPALGQELRIDAAEERSRRWLRTPEKLRGYIKVSPPRGQCFIITRTSSEPDEHICKPTTLAFTLGELQADGSLHWQVSTGPQDFGTPIAWPSPYRIGRVVDDSMPWPGPSRAVYLKSCQATRHQHLGRRVYIHLFHGEVWGLALPAHDTLAPQPAWDKPNLYILEKAKSSSEALAPAKDAKAPAGEEHGAPPAAPPPTEAPAEEAAEASPPPAAAAAPAPPSTSKKDDESSATALVSTWQIHPRHSYTMNASHFTTGPSHPPGMRGECRYKYVADEDDAEAGLLECVGADRFKWLYLPVVCLPTLAPPAAPASAAPTPNHPTSASPPAASGPANAH